MTGQCLINNLETIESKDSLSRGREKSSFREGGKGWSRKMAANFLEAVQGSVFSPFFPSLVGKGLT